MSPPTCGCQAATQASPPREAAGTAANPPKTVPMYILKYLFIDLRCHDIFLGIALIHILSIPHYTQRDLVITLNWPELYLLQVSRGGPAAGGWAVMWPWVASVRDIAASRSWGVLIYRRKAALCHLPRS